MTTEIQYDIHRANSSTSQLLGKASPEDFKAFWRNTLCFMAIQGRSKGASAQNSYPGLPAGNSQRVELLNSADPTPKAFVCSKEPSAPRPCGIYAQIFSQGLDIWVRRLPGLLQFRNCFGRRAHKVGFPGAHFQTFGIQILLDLTKDT